MNCDTFQFETQPFEILDLDDPRKEAILEEKSSALLCFSFPSLKSNPVQL